ncbi:MAG: serine/threonine protein kinase, partial [Myxococcales bacterium]|nr:serine/threonine protein kinase [Myxococcales bacterium]
MLKRSRTSLVGATIGNYEIVDKLGEGGMGTVYLARHPQIGKRVAVKVLHEEFSANEDVVTRFFNEAKAVNEIGHPNIVDVIDFGVVEQERGPGLVYFIMEYLEGESLATTIGREGALAPDRAVRIARQVAAALAASHAKGIVHRDLKPDNIVMVRRAGTDETAKVLDFGIAKLTGGQSGSQRTRTGIVMGTPAYMSPEQCEGKADLDHRADVYALGVVLYEMLTGKPPFVGTGYGEVLLQHLTRQPAPITTRRSGVSIHLDAVVNHALRKDPQARFASMEAFDKALVDPVAFVTERGGVE